MKMTKAIEAYESLAKVLPDDPDVQFALAGLYDTAGSFDKARDYYGRLLKRDPKNVEAHYGLGQVEIDAGNSQKALEYLERGSSDHDPNGQRSREVHDLVWAGQWRTAS